MQKIILPIEVKTALEKIVSEYNRNMFLLVFSINHHMDDAIINKYFIESEKLAIKKHIGLTMIGQKFGANSYNNLYVDFINDYLEIYDG